MLRVRLHLSPPTSQRSSEVLDGALSEEPHRVDSRLSEHHRDTAAYSQSGVLHGAEAPRLINRGSYLQPLGLCLGLKLIC